MGRYGWMLQLAFLCLAFGSVALLRAIWRLMRTLSGRIGRTLLFIISLAFVGATVFETDPATANQLSTTGMIHPAAGVRVVLGFPIMATLIGWSLSRSGEWASTPRWLLAVTLLVWLGRCVRRAGISGWAARCGCSRWLGSHKDERYRLTLINCFVGSVCCQPTEWRHRIQDGYIRLPEQSLNPL
jgi:hypothetical protein